MHKPIKTISGFTQFELIVVVILISILGVVALNRMWGWRIAAERTMIKTVRGNIRSALGLETAQLALHNKLTQLPRLAGSNPFLFLAQAPSDYKGVLNDNNPETQQKGIWYYNPTQKAIIYTLRYNENFKTTLKGLPRIRFRVKLIYSDKNANHRYDADMDAIAGLDLISLDKYEWLSKTFNNNLKNNNKD